MTTWYDAVSDENLTVLASPGEVELKAADAFLITASKTELSVRYKDQEAVDVGLKLWMDRSQVYRATKRTNVFDISPEQLLDFDPNTPIICEMQGDRALLDRLQTGLTGGREVESIVTDTGQDGFPVFFDLTHYKMKNLYQEKTE